MSDSPEYEYHPATVRMPKGERLADSKETPGWSRGFTPKTSEKNPEYVEILLDDDTNDSHHGFESSAQGNYTEPGAAQDDEHADVELNDLLSLAVFVAIVAAAQATAPYIKRWWISKALPFVRSRWNAVKTWQNRRKTRTSDSPASTRTTVAPLEAEDNQAARNALAAYEADMTNEEARRHLAELLIAQHFVKQKELLLANARVSDAALPPEIEGILQQLMAEQVEKAFNTLLKSPTFMEDLHKYLSARNNRELSEPFDQNFSTILELTVNHNTPDPND